MLNKTSLGEDVLPGSQSAVRESIQSVVSRCVWVAGSVATDDFLSLFSEQAVLEVAGHGSYCGIREIREGALTGFGRPKALLQQLREDGGFEQRVDFRDLEMFDKRYAVICANFRIFYQGALDHWGLYCDELQSESERWLIRHRSVYVTGAVKHSLYQDLDPIRRVGRCRYSLISGRR